MTSGTSTQFLTNTLPMNDLAKKLRENTNYSWQDCIEAANRADDYDEAREMLPAVYRQRNGIEWRGETTR